MLLLVSVSVDYSSPILPPLSCFSRLLQLTRMAPPPLSLEAIDRAQEGLPHLVNGLCG